MMKWCVTVFQKEEDNLQSLIELTSQINMEVYRALHFYNAVFEQWAPLLSLLFV